MEDTMTVDEIVERYPDEWVLIGDPNIDECSPYTVGRVLFHSKDREEVLRRAGRWDSPVQALRYTGELLDPNVVYVL